MPETIGQRLKREREARYVSLEKAAQETRIRRVFLQALEADDFSVMPSAAQGRGFLRNYAKYLDLNIDELIAEIQRNPIPPAEVSGPLPQVNLTETELPPLTEPVEEEPAPPFFARLLKRSPKPEPTPEALPVLDAEESSENPLPVEIQLDGEYPLETKEEPKQGWWGRVTSLFKVKAQKQDSVEAVEVPEETTNPVPVIEQPAQPQKPADLIMAEIGVILRERRELISLTVDEVERHTKLRVVFVKALEEGAFDKLPSTVQTRGMLSNYASFLDLDVDAVLLRYADALQARRREKYAETPREQIQTQVNPSIPMLRTFIASDLLFGVMMIVVLGGLALWGIGRIVSLQEDTQAEPTAPSIADVLGNDPLPTASPALTFVAVDDPSLVTAEAGGEETVVPVVEVTSSANVVVSVFALERAFVRISVDGEVAFEGRMLPRETKVFEAVEQVEVLTGDGSALRITYNGADLGLMGGTGEVVSRVYLIGGVATPTATIPPTATSTPQTTATVTPTVTPTPSATATP